MSASLPEVTEATARPEHELLLCCARTALDATTSARVSSLIARRDLDWGRVLRQARRHGVTPLVYRRLEADFGVGVPARVLDELKAAYIQNTRRNLLVTAELSRVLALFEASGIRAIPLKGPLLAQSVFGNLALRQFGDLDILLREQDVIRARDLLLAEGYLAQHDWTRSQEAAVLRTDCEYPMFSRERTILIELHWRIVQKWFAFPLSADQLWDRLEPAPLGSSTVWTVGPDDLLLILCVHSTKHLWSRLRWVSDVAEVARANPTLDWQRVLDRAAEFGARRMLLLGLYLARDLLDGPVPDDVWRLAQAEPNVPLLADQVRELIAREFDGPVGHGIPGYYDRSRFYVKAMERPRDRLHYCIRYLTTPTDEDWDVVRLPDALFPLYYVIRPVRLGQWLPRWVWKRAGAMISRRGRSRRAGIAPQEASEV